MNDPNVVNITLREVWESQQEQGKLLHQMHSDLKRSLDSHDRVRDMVDDHEDRIRSIERRVWQASGAAALIGATLGTLVNLLVK